MKKHIQPALRTLSQQDIEQVHGAGMVRKPLQAEDMYGNTMSIEEWMDRQIAVANSNGVLDPHDFYSPGYNGNKPNIWH